MLIYGQQKKPEDVPRLALNQIITALDDFVDTIELRGLPLSYKRLAAAEPSGWTARILGIDYAVDSVQEIARLSPVLEALDARLVLMVEDVDRVGEAFDSRHLERFLWALRSLNRSTFVVAVKPDCAPVDFVKLCDTIERVPMVRVEQVARMLIVSYDRWTSAYDDIDPHPNRSDTNKFRLGMVRSLSMRTHLEDIGWHDTPLGALVSLLQTPRALKHVVSRVDQTWHKLHGEAELDDIIIISALRHGAPTAYTFLLANISTARYEPSELSPRTMTVKADWKSLVSKEANGVAVQRLVDLLGIKQLVISSVTNSTRSPQGVHTSDPVDYFSRIVAEQLAPSELRDQDVLRHIELWKSGQRDILVDRLAPKMAADNHYRDVWNKFAKRHSKTDFMVLTELVAARILKNQGSSATAEHPTLMALWRHCRESLPHSQHGQWLADLIKRAIPISLAQVNGLFYYWVSKCNTLDATRKEAIRQEIIKEVRVKLLSPDGLVRALSKDHPKSIRTFIMTINGSNSFEEWGDYFAPLLIKSARLDPEIVLPQLVHLAVDDLPHIPVANAGSVDLYRQYQVDRDRLRAFFQEWLDDALTLLSQYMGTNVRALTAKEDAKKWLRDRATE